MSRECPWPWCEACQSWHHPDNPTCRLKANAVLAGLSERALPRYEHGCPNCRFLGCVAKYDLYVCETSETDISVLARYSSDVPSYASLGFMREAIGRQIRSGLEGDMAIVAAIFERLPSLILNIWERP